MAVACPNCDSSELELDEILEDQRRQIRCESCGHVWIRGESKPIPRRPKSVPAESTKPIVFNRDDQAYLAWVRTWSYGYVLNCERVPNANYLMLHRADCYTITEPGPQATTWTEHDYIKVCSTDRQQLRQWASDQTGSEPTSCRLCM